MQIDKDKIDKKAHHTILKWVSWHGYEQEFLNNRRFRDMTIDIYQSAIKDFQELINE